MKFNNKTLIIFALIVVGLLYFSVNILPGLFLQSIQYTSDDTLQKYARIGSGDLDIKGMSVITRSDKLYYSPTGPIPTNKIWSSVVFKGQITGLYTYPLASNTANGTLNITLPKKIVYPKLITSQLISEFVSIKGSDDVDKVSVESYSDLSVTLNFINKFGSVIFTGTFIQGSPYIFIHPNQDTLNISSDFYKINKTANDWVYSYEDKNLALFSNGSFTQNGNNLQVKFNNLNGAYLTVAAVDLNSNNFEQIKALAANIIDSVNSGFIIKDNKIEVTYEFKFDSANSTETIFGMLPNQYDNGGFDITKNLFKFNTLRGDQYFFRTGKDITYSIPRVPLTDEFKFETFTPADKTYMTGLIEQDLKDIVYVRSATYFGGNDMLKLANLLQISDQIGNTDLVNRIKTRMDQEFDDWFSYKDGKTGKYFAFDEAWGGIIGYETSGFGGENYNDHHFQYGYFIHAAAILAKYDSSFVAKYGYFINDLVMDIANTDKSNPSFPYLRYFDQYEGHSWATGMGDFSDGNNQESSSEAVNAWYSIWLWSQVTNNSDLKNFSEYLYSSEVNSTRIYWLNWNNDASIFPSDYQPNKAGVVWGGKVEYQTFFSTDPQSIEGIQYLPFTPGALYLYNPTVIQRDLNYFKSNLDDTSAALNDMNYLYYAMLKGFGILPQSLIESMKIDQGNSRANMYYWTKFWDNVKTVDTIVNGSGGSSYRITFKDGTQTTL